MVPSETWYEEQVLKALAWVKDNAGATCQNMSRQHVRFWPLYPLQRLHRMGQVKATWGGSVLTSSVVADLHAIESADSIVWQLTPAGQDRASRLQ